MRNWIRLMMTMIMIKVAGRRCRMQGAGCRMQTDVVLDQMPTHHSRRRVTSLPTEIGS